MNGKRYAIPDRVAALALKYGYNVSRGIQKMEEIIQKKLSKEEKNE
jgi:hypothetical protein